MSNQKAARERRREKIRMQTGSTLILLDRHDLAVKKIAAAQCELVCYSQDDRAGQRRHFVSTKQQAPFDEGSPFEAHRVDPTWFVFPEKHLRGVDALAMADIVRGIRVDRAGRVTAPATAPDAVG